ncbi:MAG: ssDNA-binding protein, partial [Alphaproteobacteria bacterium]
QDRVCFFDGNDVTDDEGTIKDGYEDMMVIKGSNERPLDLRNRNKSRAEKDSDPFYGGCYVEATLRLYGTEAGGSKGVFASLELVRFLEKGDPFGAPPVDDSILDDYDDIEDDEDDDDDMLG